MTRRQTNNWKNHKPSDWKTRVRDVMRLLVEERWAARITQAQIAKATGMCVSSVSKAESLDIEPPLSFMRAYAGELGYLVQVRLIPLDLVPKQDHPDINKGKKAGEERLGTAKDLDP